MEQTKTSKMATTAKSGGFNNTTERFIVLPSNLPPSINYSQAYSKAMTRSQQRFYVYADQDRLISEGIRLLSE